jgi:hypothetical protein
MDLTRLRHQELAPVNLKVLAACQSYNAQPCTYTLQGPLRDIPADDRCSILKVLAFIANIGLAPLI